MLNVMPNFTYSAISPQQKGLRAYTCPRYSLNYTLLYSLLQQLSIPKSAVGTTPAHLVDFEVSPAGLGMTDPSKRVFSRKNFSVKHITYVVRIR